MATNDKSSNDIFDYTELIETLFIDISLLPSEKKDLFLDLFFDREEDFIYLTTKLKEIQSKRENFLIIGRTGVGKTSFLKRFVFDIDLNRKLNIYSIFVDYRKSIPRTWQQCIINFVENIQKKLEPLEKINGLKENSIQNIDFNFNKIYNHIKYLSSKPTSPYFFIILDDFDYAEDQLFYLLRYFMPFAEANSPASILFSIRPPLKAEIESYDSRYTYNFLRNTYEIKLDTLNIGEIIASRLAPILAKKEIDKEKMGILVGIISKFKNRTNVEKLLNPIIKKLGINNLKDLKLIEYPLTIAHNSFMKRITNGDIREIFTMAFESLNFIIKNSGNLETRSEDGFNKKVIGHENTLRLFYDNTSSKYKIININKRTSKSGNSLYYNTLEAIKGLGIIDNNFFSILSKFGHNEIKVNEAINFLLSKENRFIEPIRLLSLGKRERKGFPNEFIVTEKGEFYLRMAHTWPEYIKRCKHYGKSLLQSLSL